MTKRHDTKEKTKHFSDFGFRISDFLSVSKRQKGFTLLLAVVLSSLLLSIGIAVFNSTFKGLELSSLGRDSQFAFYSADAGLECALYWDIRESAFATSSASILSTSSVECREQNIADGWSLSRDATSARTTFTLFFPPEEACAIVVVDKREVLGVETTTIESRGYNTCSTTSTRRVERAIRTTYE